LRLARNVRRLHGATRTLQLIVERSLKDQVDERIQVIPV